MEKEAKVLKRITFTESELNEIESAMKEEGFKNYHEYFVHMTRTRMNRNDSVTRWRTHVKYQCSSIYTICNKIKSGIYDEKTIEDLEKELDVLCRELR